jgi:hypothetical protein
MKKNLFLAAASLLFLFSCTSEPKENITEKNSGDLKDHMEHMRDSIKNSGKPVENPYKNAKLETRVFNNDSVKSDAPIHGFGYDIYMYDALYVHQPHVPAINGNRGFHSREQAQKTADLVLYKIRNNIMPPSLTVNELDSIGALK